MNLRSVEEYQWDDPEGFEDYHQPFKAPDLDQETREAAYVAVHNAIAAYHEQKWWQTALARARFAGFWITYWVRLRIAMFGVTRLGWDDRKTWNRLGL